MLVYPLFAAIYNADLLKNIIKNIIQMNWIEISIKKKCNIMKNYNIEIGFYNGIWNLMKNRNY